MPTRTKAIAASMGVAVLISENRFAIDNNIRITLLYFETRTHPKQKAKAEREANAKAAATE